MVMLSSLCCVTDIVLTVTRPIWDGGLFDFVLNKVVSSNSSSETATPADHVWETVRSGGFLAVLVYGLIRSLILLIVAIVLCVFHCRRKPFAVTSRNGKVKQKKHRPLLCRGIHFIVSDIFVVFAFFLCVLTLIVNAHLHNSLMSNESRDAVVPRVVHSLKTVHDYVRHLTPHIRSTTEPIVEEIIRRSDVMQNSYRTIFGMTLNKKMQGGELQKRADVMMEYIAKIYDSMQTIMKTEHQMSESQLEDDLEIAKKRLEACCEKLESGSMFSKRLIRKCNDLKKYFQVNGTNERISVFDLDAISHEPAKTLIVLLKVSGNTPASMKAEEAETLKKRKVLEKKWQSSSNQVSSKINAIIRNSTRKQLDGLESTFKKFANKINSISSYTFNEGRHKIVHYEKIRNTVYISILFLVVIICLMCGFIFIYHSCASEKLAARIVNSCQYLLHASICISSVAFLVSTATFLTGGYAYTEVCRYLEEPAVKHDNRSAMHLDGLTNAWLERRWSVIKAEFGNETSTPIPRPKDIFHGIQTSCKANKSILMATNVLDELNSTSLMNSEMTDSFLEMGRVSMHENIRGIDVSILLRPKMKESLERLVGLMGTVLQKDYQSYITALSKPLYRFDLKDLKRDMKDFLQLISNESRGKRVPFESRLAIGKYEYAFNLSMTSTDKFKALMETQKKAFITLETHNNISSVVRRMYPAIDVLSSYVNNKTRWLEVADQLYDQIIVKNTKKTSPKIVAEAFGDALSTLGPCRSLFDAYENAVFATCTLTVRPLNVMWLLLGSSVLFLTLCITVALLILMIRGDSRVYYLD